MTDFPTHYNGTVLPEVVWILENLGCDRKKLYTGAPNLYDPKDVDFLLTTVGTQKLRVLKPFYNPKGDNSRVADLLVALTRQKKPQSLTFVKWVPDTLVMDGGRESIVMLAIIQSLGHVLSGGPNILVVLPEEDEFNHIEELFYVYLNRLREFYDRPPVVKIVRTHVANNKDELREMYPRPKQEEVKGGDQDEARSA